MWQLFIVTFLDRWGNPIWSSLIHFGQIWSKKIKNKTAIFIPSVNVTTFYSKIFWLVRNSLWSSFIKFHQVWSSLIYFWQIWSKKKIKKKIAIFNHFINVTTFYTDIFCYVQPLRSFFCRKTDTQTLVNRTDGAAQIVV